MNNNRISIVSSNPNAQAGKRGTRILDEFALHQNPEQLYRIAYPGITWGGQLEIISTHRGCQNFFNTLIQEIHNGNPKKISHHRVTLQDALDQGFLQTLKASLPPSDPRQSMDEATYFDFIRKACPDEESFLQEYMCQPVNYDAYFLTPNLVTSCEYASTAIPNEVEEVCFENGDIRAAVHGSSRRTSGEADGAYIRYVPKPNPDLQQRGTLKCDAYTDADWQKPLYKLRYSPNDFYMGIDIGRINDFTVFWLIEVINNVYFTRHVRSLKKCDFETQEKILQEFTILPNLRRICVDKTCMGIPVTERIQKIFSPHLVEGITFTNTLKEKLAHTVRSALETRALYLPPDPLIRSDLLSLRRQLTSTGKVRLDTHHSSIGHADHFWALSLALYAAKSLTSFEYHYEPFYTSKYSPTYYDFDHLFRSSYRDFLL